MSTKSSSKKSCDKTASESSSGTSVLSDAGHAVGVTSEWSFVGIVADHSNSSISDNGFSPPPSVQQSIQCSVPTAAGQAVGASANCAILGAIINDPKVDQTLISPDSSFCVDGEEPGRGGVNDDSASLEVSAITPARSAYTQPLSVTMNKLHFSSLGLHGRQNEIDLLRACFDRFVIKNMTEGESLPSVSDSSNAKSRSSEVLFISGESGTGKVSFRILVDYAHTLKSP